MSLHQISRLSGSVDKLGSIYSTVSEEIESLKSTKKQIKQELKNARAELEAMKGASNSQAAAVAAGPSSSDWKLAKADKRTAIKKLDHQLARLEQALGRLEEENRRVFSKREGLKAKMVKKMVDAVHEGVSVARVEDLGTVAKIVEWIRVEPRVCRVASSVSDRSPEIVEEMQAEARRLNLKIEFQSGGDR